MGRGAVAVLVLVTLAWPSRLWAQAPTPADPELAQGVRQVNEGDFEGAIVTLEPVAQRLAGQPARSRDLAQACLHLGIAYLALNRNEEAKARFRQALASDPRLRLTPQRFSPKVIGAFEEVRKEQDVGSSAKPADGKGTKKALVFLGLGGAAAAGVAIAVGGGGETAGAIGFTDAHFETPVITCPNGSVDVPLVFGVLVSAANERSEAVTIDLVSTVAIIEASPGIPGEVGFSNNRPSMVSPTTVPAKSRITFGVESSILCTNTSEDDPRFNEWSARITLTTSAGVFTVATLDRMRINIP